MEASLAADPRGRKQARRGSLIPPPVQLLLETKVPIPATKQHAQRVDDEYERHGTASILMFAEPLSGWQQATARPRRTKVDWAFEVAHLLDTRFASCEKITLVCVNLNTHDIGVFYEAFAPDIAECELSCLTSPCLTGRRIGELEKLQTEIKTWSEKINAKQCGVDWQFQITDARTKLKQLNPVIQGG